HVRSTDWSVQAATVISGPIPAASPMVTATTGRLELDPVEDVAFCAGRVMDVSFLFVRGRSAVRQGVPPTRPGRRSCPAESPRSGLRLSERRPYRKTGGRTCGGW